MKSFPRLKNQLILAPMAEVSDLAFRLLCRRYGTALAYTEQLSSTAIVRENKKTFELAETNKEDKPVGLQIFGRNPETLVEAARKLEKNFDVIDLNCGCPSKKIVQQGYGSALLKEKETLFEIVHALATNVSKPVTVKMRSRFKRNEAIEIVKVIERAGAAAVTIHGRTQEQGYSGKANWDIIKEVKESVSIPVIGNGDVDSPEKAEELLKSTKCDYIMIGRAAKSNPWIFKQILHYFGTGELLEQTREEKLHLLNEYLMLAHRPNIKTVRERAMDFTKGLEGSSQLRVQIQKLQTVEAIQKAIASLK